MTIRRSVVGTLALGICLSIVQAGLAQFGKIRKPLLRKSTIRKPKLPRPTFKRPTLRPTIRPVLPRSGGPGIGRPKLKTPSVHRRYGHKVHSPIVPKRFHPKVPSVPTSERLNNKGIRLYLKNYLGHPADFTVTYYDLTHRKRTRTFRRVPNKKPMHVGNAGQARVWVTAKPSDSGYQLVGEKRKAFNVLINRGQLYYHGMIRKISTSSKSSGGAKNKTRRGSRPGQVFETRSGSRFVRRRNGAWTEYRRNGRASSFRKVSENSVGNLKFNLVRLYDASRKISVILGPHEALWKHDRETKFRRWPGSEGSWKR